MTKWLQRKIKDPLLQILRRNAEPKKLAFSAALGTTLGIFPICGALSSLGVSGMLMEIKFVFGVTVFLCGIAVAMLGSHCHPPTAMLANFVATPIELGLVIPYLRLGEYITGGPQFPLNSDALKKVLTGKATTEVLQSILHALLGWLVTTPFVMVALYLLFVPCFTFLVEKFGSGPSSPKRSLSPVELRVKITD